MDKNNQQFRLVGVETVSMITTLEGEGTPDNPIRHVHHIFRDNELVGVIDTISPNEHGRNLQNAINAPLAS